MLDLNTRHRVGLKTLPNLKFKLKFWTQISNSNLNFKKLKSSLSSRVIRDSGILIPRVKGMKSTKQWVGFQVRQLVAQGVGQRVFRISVLLSSFHFVGSEEKVSGTKRNFVSSCLGIIYLALVISNPYSNFKNRRHKIIPLVPLN